MSHQPKIGILSDTHGLLRDNVIAAVQDCDVILHCGDIHTREILSRLEAVTKTYAVRGNADKEWAASLPATLRLSLYGIQIFMIHNRKHITEDTGDCDLILYGHSHRYEQTQTDGQTWLNPGSCGPRRFTQPATMAVIQIADNGTFQIIRIDLAKKAASSDLRSLSGKDIHDIISAVIKDTDKGHPVTDIANRNNISEELASQICRLYLTHPGATVDDVLNKMEILEK